MARSWLLCSLIVACSATDDAPTTQARSDAATFSGCPAEAARALQGLQADTDAGALTASITSATPPSPVKFDNTWTLRVLSADGPATDVSATTITTYMPLHGHEGRPPSTVESGAEPGQLDAAVYFMMRGYWEVRIDLESASLGSDRATFHVCVEE